VQRAGTEDNVNRWARNEGSQKWALTVGCPPMLVALILIAEAAITWCTPCMLHRGLQMPFKLEVGVEAQQACQAHELMADAVVVLKMILETPLILKGAQTEVTIHLMVPRVVDMVLQAIAVLEDALTEIAVVLVVKRLLDVVEKRYLIQELQRADAAPVLVWITLLFGALVR
jgi:hypothetical protein